MSRTSACRAAREGCVTVIALLRLVGAVPKSDVVPFVLLLASQAVLTVVQSVLLGSVVSTLRTVVTGLDPVSALTGPLAGLVTALVASAAIQSGTAVAATRLERSVNGQVREAVRTAVGADPSLSTVEDPGVQADATAATEGAHSVLLGAASVDTVRVVFQYLNAGLLVLVVLRASVPSAVLVMAAIVATRVLSMNIGVRRLMPRLRANMSEQRALYLRGLVMGARPAKEARIFGTGLWLTDRMTEEWNAFHAPIFSVRRGYLWRFTLLYLSLAFAYVLAMVPMVNAALSGQLGLQPFVAAISAAAAMLLTLSQSYTRYLLVGGPVRAYQRLLRRHPPPAGPVGVLPSDAPHQEIRFDRLVFAYPGASAPVFNGLDLVLHAGESVGLVGLNGAGKTTLVKLLSGLYQPQAGRITIDGVELSTVRAQDWSARLAVVFQDFVHYELSMADNIRFGRLHGSDGSVGTEVLDDVVEQAALDRLVRRSPGGLDTPLSTAYAGGTELSGGEWQRVALARALYALRGGAKVLILDEPTAAYDVRAEEQLFSRFLELTQGLTTLLISHRLSAVRRAHRIVVLDGGRIVEDGSHDELLAAGGNYARLFAMQAKGIRDGRYESDPGVRE